MTSVLRRDLSVSAVVIAAYVACALYAGWHGDAFAVYIGAYYVAMASVAVGALVYWVARALRLESWSGARVATFSLALLAASLVAGWGAIEAEKHGIQEGQRRGYALAARLDRFRADRGRYPATLRDLEAWDGVPTSTPPTDGEGWQYDARGDGYSIQCSGGFVQIWTLTNDRPRWESD